MQTCSMSRWPFCRVQPFPTASRTPITRHRPQPGFWNDGINRVGREGKGESVWLGWFLCNVTQQLIDNDPGLLHLLAPPFEKSANNPGYIQAYPPGVRENGGQ